MLWMSQVKVHLANPRILCLEQCSNVKINLLKFNAKNFVSLSAKMYIFDLQEIIEIIEILIKQWNGQDF